MSKYPRRLLFLVPLVLLGAALLVRSCLPRPQTEGDKWLWEQGESATNVDVLPSSEAYIQSEMNKPANTKLRGLARTQKMIDLGQSYGHVYRVLDRQGIRALMRAFQDLPIFQPFGSNPKVPPSPRWGTLDIFLSVRPDDNDATYTPGSYAAWMRLYQVNGRSYLWRSNGTYAPLDAASVKRFYHAYHEAIIKARRSEPGYVDCG